MHQGKQDLLQATRSANMFQRETYRFIMECGAGPGLVLCAGPTPTPTLAQPRPCSGQGRGGTEISSTIPRFLKQMATLVTGSRCATEPAAIVTSMLDIDSWP